MEFILEMIHIITMFQSMVLVVPLLALTCHCTPPSISVTSASTSSLLVTFGKAPNSPTVTVYRATSGDSACEVAANKSPLACTLAGLSGGSVYMVQAITCSHNGDCSEPAYEEGYTLPDAPTRIAIYCLTMHSSLEVSLNAYHGNPLVPSFRVNVKGGSVNTTCIISRYSNPWVCPVFGLFSGSKYTIQVVACLYHPPVCSAPATLTAFTTPSEPSISVQEVNPTAVVVKIGEPEGDPAIELYKVNLVNGAPDQSCIISTSVGVPLECQVNNLTVGTIHTVEVKACVPGNDVCSFGTELHFAINPKAPANVETRAHSTSSMAVTVTPPEDTSGISYYMASTERISSCRVLASTTPLTCMLEGLPSAGTEFAVEVVACSSDDVCSGAVSGNGFTLPDGIRTFTVSSVTQTSWNMDMLALEGNPAVDHYFGVTELNSFRRECSVKADAKPLQCPITGLSRKTRYQTSVKACLPGSAGCGEAKVLPVSTKP